jgi:hypothetical protein
MNWVHPESARTAIDTRSTTDPTSARLDRKRRSTATSSPHLSLILHARTNRHVTNVDFYSSTETDLDSLRFSRMSPSLEKSIHEFPFFPTLLEPWRLVKPNFLLHLRTTNR